MRPKRREEMPRVGEDAEAEERAGRGGEASVVQLYPNAPRGQSHQDVSSAQLLEAINGGERWAAQLFYDRYSALVHKLVWVVLGADPDHEDMVQDVFLRLLKNLHKVRTPQALTSWVQRVTVNTLRSQLRRRSVRRRFGGEVEDVDRHLHAVEDPVARDLLREVYAILDSMSADLRIAFTLRYIEGHTVNEVAESCGVSRSTMKRRLGKAQKRFVLMASKNPDLAERLASSPNFKVDT